MAAPLRRKEPCPSSSASSRAVQDHPKEKKAKTEGEKISLGSFLLRANRGLDICVLNGLISQGKKVELLSPYTRDDKDAMISLEESEQWFAKIFRSVAERIYTLSGNNLGRAWPPTISREDFTKQATCLLGEYTTAVQKCLHQCAEACRANQALCWAPENAPLLPLRTLPIAEQEPSKEDPPLNAKLKILYEYLEMRKTYLIGLQNAQYADDYETVTLRLWHQESRGLFALSIGHEALEWASKIFLLLQKGDFRIQEKRKEFEGRVARFTKGVKDSCCKASKIDFAIEVFSIAARPDEYHFPISSKVKNPAEDPCISSARRIKDWMFRHRAQPILQAIPEFPQLMQKVRSWAEGNLRGELLKSELDACAEISASLNKK